MGYILKTPIYRASTVQSTLPANIDDIPPKPDDVSGWLGKLRHMHVVVRNKTQFDVEVQPWPPFWWYGKAVTSPTDIDPFKRVAWTMSNKDWALTGCHGGVRYKIRIDDSKTFDFSIGYQCPLFGPYLAKVGEGSNSSDAESACKNAKQELTEISSEIFEGYAYDDENQKVNCRIRISCVPSANTVVEIKQIVTNI